MNKINMKSQWGKIIFGLVAFLSILIVISIFNSKQNEPLSYINSNSSVSKETKLFDLNAADLKYQADECGTSQSLNYFNTLIFRFAGAYKTVYKFKYKGETQGDGTFVVTLLPNKIGYTSMEQFKKDFDICSVAGDAYPSMLNNNWLVFVSSCGSGFSDGSGLPLGCDEVKKIVEPSLKLN